MRLSVFINKEMLSYQVVICVVDQGYESATLLCILCTHNGAKYMCSTHTYSSSRVVRKEEHKRRLIYQKTIKK